MVEKVQLSPAEAGFLQLSGEDLKLGLEWLGGDLEGFKKGSDKIPFNFPLERTSLSGGCVRRCGPGGTRGEAQQG